MQFLLLIFLSFLNPSLCFNIKHKDYYKYHPDIHILGNHGHTGNLHSQIAPCVTKLIDHLAYDGYDVRKNILNNIGESNSVLDLCCGVGIFGILMSKFFKNVIGIHNNPCNSEMVKRNCELNSVNNYTYYEGNVEDNLDKILKDKKICSIVLNPPRRGLYEKFIE